MKKHFKRITPDKRALEKYKVLKPIAHWFADPRIWHFNRRTIAVGVALGFFFGSLPIAGQMFLAAVVAIMLRVNMPIAVAATWITNPFTMAFFFTGNYYVGAWLLGKPFVKIGDIDWSVDGMLHLGGDILVPLYFGSIVIGVLLFALSFLVIRLLWRLHVVNYHKRRINRK